MGDRGHFREQRLQRQRRGDAGNHDQKDDRRKINRLDNADLKATVAVIDPAKTRRLDGRILFNGGDLSIVNTLIGSDEKVEGRLNVDVALSGTLLKPLLNGGIALTDARVSEGAVPLVMKPSNIRIDFAGDTSTLEGRLETSQGALDLAGDAQWRDMAHPTANVHASGSDIRFDRSGMKMSLDGIAKGYIADEGARLLRESGVRNFLVNAGGDIVAQGGKNGAPWRVAVENPEKYRGNTAYPAVRNLTNQAMATSGTYENRLDGKGTLNHILNPANGLCATVPGASVVAASAMEADALATALCVMSRPVAFMEGVPQASCLITLPTGKVQRSSRWS